jgi:hypothetical protein
MFRDPMYALLFLIFIVSSCADTVGAQSQSTSPAVILEAISTFNGLGADQDKHLLLRLRADGRLDWDKVAGYVWERQTSFVNERVVSDVERALDTVRLGSVRGAMGPYFIYEDSSVEIQVQMTARKREITFLAINPWWDVRARKHMPKDLKTVICEINSLRALVASDSVDQLCKGGEPLR